MLNKGMGFLLCLMVLSYMPSGSAASIVEEGLVSYWSFNEGTVLNDIVQDVMKTNDGTIVGQLDFVDGKLGQALRSDNTTSYVEVASDALAGATTITVWVMPEAFTDTHYVFGHSTLPVWKDRVQIYCDNGDNQLDIGLGDTHARHTNVAPLEIGQWTHIGLVYTDTPEGDYAVYVNGELKAEGSFTGLNALMGFADIANNGGQTSRNQGWLGLIDEFCLYDRALSPDEIRQNYEAEGLAVTPRGKLGTVWGRLKAQAR